MNVGRTQADAQFALRLIVKKQNVVEAPLTGLLLQTSPGYSLANQHKANLRLRAKMFGRREHFVQLLTQPYIARVHHDEVLIQGVRGPKSVASFQWINCLRVR